MADREKVIASLKACAREDTVSCEKAGCKYCDADDCSGALARDVLELLKAQEPVKPKTYNGGGKSPTWWYVCGACGYAVDPKDKFCRECGKAVNWDAFV